MKYVLAVSLGSLFTVGSTWAFVPVQERTAACSRTKGHNKINIVTPFPRGDEDNDLQMSFSALCSDKKKKGGLDESMRNKLVTESIAPWRTLRLFLYGSLGSGAFVGGLINGSGAIAASASPEFNLQTEVRFKYANIKVVTEAETTMSTR